MTEEEKKTLSIIWNHIQENGIEQGIANGYYLDFLKRLGEKVEKLQKENEELRHYYDIATTEIEKLKVQKNITEMKSGALKRLLENSIPKEKIRELIGYYKNEMKSENDLLEQKIITRKDYERRRSLHNNYIHILNKLLE